MPAGEIRPIEEVLPTVGVAIVGGFQEPAHLVASTLYGLLTHPDQAQLVIEDPETWARPAIEEGLRWLSPFGMTEKLTTQDVLLAGVRIPAGTEVSLVIGSANRDPARFERPEAFDITRTDQGNLSFGFGSHFCIGHHVARALGEVMLTETFATLPGLQPRSRSTTGDPRLVDPGAEALASSMECLSGRRAGVAAPGLSVGRDTVISFIGCFAEVHV